MRIHVRQFIKGSYHIHIREDRQRVKTKVAVRSVNIQRGIPKGKSELGGNRSKQKHQSDQVTKTKGIIQVIEKQRARQNHTVT